MNEELELQLAEVLSKKLHQNQKDKSDKDYYEVHIKTVVNGVSSIKEKTVAYLHDVVEDTNFTLEDLSKLFSRDIVEAVKLLTKTSRINYLDYIEKIKTNNLARVVKLSDLAHNSDLDRLTTITKKDLDRVEKYKKAINILIES